jgi:surface protein
MEDEGNESGLQRDAIYKNGELHSALSNKGKRRRLDPMWQSFVLLLPEDLLLPILAYLDVKTLIEKKQVSRSWRVSCTEAIDAKRTASSRKSFTTNQELCEAVKKYCGYNQDTHSYSQCFDPQDAEEIAQTYGYPINKWDVSTVQDFSLVFFNMVTFNEDISSWNVSNATTMDAMFSWAKTFHQDLSPWNVSNVTDASFMFSSASSFNQNLSTWNVANVRSMKGLFSGATSFNQNLSDWNVSNVNSMYMMFRYTSSFNQNLSLWNVSNVQNNASDVSRCHLLQPEHFQLECVQCTRHDDDV